MAVEEISASLAAVTMGAATETIELEVGEAVFKTSVSTLLRHHDSFFGALARNRGDATRLFVDRDPTTFDTS